MLSSAINLTAELGQFDESSNFSRGIGCSRYSMCKGLQGSDGFLGLGQINDSWHPRGSACGPLPLISPPPLASASRHIGVDFDLQERNPRSSISRASCLALSGLTIPSHPFNAISVLHPASEEGVNRHPKGPPQSRRGHFHCGFRTQVPGTAHPSYPRFSGSAGGPLPDERGQLPLNGGNTSSIDSSS